MKRTTVIIDRQKWSRGDLGQNALLVSGDTVSGSKLFSSGKNHPKIGGMCCLGFACRVLGVKPKEMRGISMPGSVSVNRALPGLTEKSPYGDYFGNTTFAKEAAGVNDNANLTDKQREKKLKSLAWKNGFIFKFIN